MTKKRGFAMYRITLVLGLLVTPAFAMEKYTPEECAGIEKMLNKCTKPIGRGWTTCHPGGGASYLLLQGKYPNDWGQHCWWEGTKNYCEWNHATQELFDLCEKICQHQITPRDALYNYCP
jgi:hypothetical protein